MEERDKSSLRVVGNPTLGVGWLHEHSIQQPHLTLYHTPPNPPILRLWKRYQTPLITTCFATINRMISFARQHKVKHQLHKVVAPTRVVYVTVWS